jgi:hypothetical protein
MWRGGYVTVIDAAGQQLQTWQSEQVWRERRERVDLRIAATDRGAGLV